MDECPCENEATAWLWLSVSETDWSWLSYTSLATFSTCSDRLLIWCIFGADGRHPIISLLLVASAIYVPFFNFSSQGWCLEENFFRTYIDRNFKIHIPVNRNQRDKKTTYGDNHFQLIWLWSILYLKWKQFFKLIKIIKKLLPYHINTVHQNWRYLW